MNDILAVAANWWSLPIGLLITGISLGFVPGFLLRQIVRFYPEGDERRTELFAELRSLPYLERVLWVFEQLETGIVDGRRARHAKHAHAPALPEHVAMATWIDSKARSANQSLHGFGGLSGELERKPGGGIWLVVRGNNTGQRISEHRVPDHLQQYAELGRCRRGRRPLW